MLDRDFIGKELARFEQFIRDIEASSVDLRSKGSSFDEAFCYQSFKDILRRREEKKYANVVKIFDELWSRIEQRKNLLVDNKSND